MSNRVTKKDCVYCHKSFNAKRRDALYCSRTCEQYAYLVRKSKREAMLSEYYNPYTITTIHNTVKLIFDDYCKFCSKQSTAILDINKVLDYSESCLGSKHFESIYRNSVYNGIIEDIRSELLKAKSNRKGFIICVESNNEIIKHKTLFEE